MADDESEEEVVDNVGLTDPYNEGSETYYREALNEFLLSQMTTYQYFLNGTRTSFTESFHNVCNLYYPKGLSMSFAQYKMRKQFAALHWNELRNAGYLSFDVIASFGWQEHLMNKFIDYLRSSDS
jgi:hypothetical protein